MVVNGRVRADARLLRHDFVACYQHLRCCLKDIETPDRTRISELRRKTKGQIGISFKKYYHVKPGRYVWDLNKNFNLINQGNYDERIFLDINDKISELFFLSSLDYSVFPRWTDSQIFKVG
jgi:hypothetical protein